MNRHKTFSRSPIVIIVLVLLLAISLAGCSSAPRSVSEPASGTVLSGYAPKDGSQITVSIAPTQSCVVMLKDTSDRTLLSFFVRSGDTVTVDVPAEMMYVHFASGKAWYGEEQLFGKDTTYTKDDELTDFTQYSWEYEFDPLSDTGFEYEGADDDFDSYIEPAVTYDNSDIYVEPELPSGYIGDLGGSWETVYLEDGNSSLSVSALAFSETIYNCTSMTVNMGVEMNAGTSCKDWQLWGRNGNTFVKLAKIYLPAGEGYTSQTVTFNSPVTFDAVAVTPTIVGGYSWSMSLSVTDVWVDS